LNTCLLSVKQAGNPDAGNYLILANCFSAQALAFAMVLVDEFVEAGVDLKDLKDVDDLSRRHPPEQTWEDRSPPFPIVRTRDTQLGLIKNDLVMPDHWIFEGMQPERGLLYVHSQAILLDILEALMHVKPRILVVRHVPVYQGGGTPVKRLADMYIYSHPDGSPRTLNELLVKLGAAGEDGNGHRDVENCLSQAGLAQA
jgi:hypothetical protein